MEFNFKFLEAFLEAYFNNVRNHYDITTFERKGNGIAAWSGIP